jgi:hypothetical protein
MSYREEGFVVLQYKGIDTLMVVSPDGSLTERHSNTTLMAVEFKCPFSKTQTQFPPRYLLQCLSEMEALHVESLIYIFRRPDVSTVFRVKRNFELFEPAMDLAWEIYGVEKNPSKLSPGVNDLKQDIVAVNSSVEIIGQFHSIRQL